MKLENEDIISMIMIEMRIIGMIKILGMKGMIGMTELGFKNHKGMSLRNLIRMLGRR